MADSPLDEIRMGRVQSIALNGRPTLPAVTVEVWPDDLVMPDIEDLVCLMAKQALREASASKVPC